MVKYQLIANANSSPNTQIICWWTLKLREYIILCVTYNLHSLADESSIGGFNIQLLRPACSKPLILTRLFKTCEPVSFHLWLPPSTECLPIDHSAPDHQSVCVGMRLVSVFSNWISPNKWVSQLSWVAPVTRLRYILHFTPNKLALTPPGGPAQ